MTDSQPPVTEADDSQPDSVFGVTMSTTIVLLLFTVVFTALMALTYEFTRDAIEQSQKEMRLALLGQVLPEESYDNALLEDVIVLPPTAALGTEEYSSVWRARRQGKPVALLVEAIAPDGYAGRIEIIIAVKVNGELAAVRVTQHRETPGLGDYIDPEKDRNKDALWIDQFAGMDSNILSPELWKIKKDGGRIDARAGASISARAVTKAVAKAYAWTMNNRLRLFDLPALSNKEGT